MKDTPTDSVVDRLQTIWASVLKQDVGEHANFFELGGNSIQLISMLLHVNQHFGIEMSPDEFTREASIAHLAQCISRQLYANGQSEEDSAQATTPAGESTPAASKVTGPATSIAAQQILPLLPVHYWFLQRLTLNHFNVGYLYQVPPGDDPALLQQAFAAVIARHDGLRMLLQQATDGSWHQVLQAVPQMTNWWHTLDLAEVPDAELAQTITRHCEQFQASLDVNSQALAIVHIDAGHGRGARLLVLIHHILLDNICERVLWHDVETAYRQLQQGQTVQFKNSGRSVADWSHTLARHAETGVNQFLPYWQGLNWDDYRPLPLEPQASQAALLPRPTTKQGLEGLAFVADCLSAADTEQLMTLQQRSGIDASVVVMAALALAFRDWSGSGVLSLATIHNGRIYHTIPQANLLNAVGWLINYSLLPIHLQPELSGRQLLESIIEQAGRLKDDSLSYTCLKHMHPDPAVREFMAALPPYHIGFNFIPFAADTASSFMFDRAPESAGENEKWFDPDIKPFIDVFFANKQLRVGMGYSPCMYSENTIQHFVQQVIRHIANIVHQA